MRSKLFVILCLLLPLFILLPGFSNFVYPAGSDYSDLIISHYPNLLYLKNSLIQWHVVPLWSNTILSGYPFAANPLSSLWYPFTWVLLVLPQPFGYNLIILFHLLLGGMGIYLSLRRFGLGLPASVTGAVCFELMPKLMAHYAAGHITLLFAVCLTPWIVYTEIRYKLTPTAFWKYAPGLIIGMIALADIRWLPYAGGLWLLLRLSKFTPGNGYSFHWPISRKEISTQAFIARFRWHSIGDLAIPVITAIGISAPVWLPLIQYSNLSTRAAMTSIERMDFSLSPLRLLGLYFPDMQGYGEFVIYPGILCLLSVFVIVSFSNLRKKNLPWLCLLFISILVAFGSATPLGQVLAGLPGFTLLRVPARALFLSGLAFSFLAGSFVDALLNSQILIGKSRTAIFCVIAFSVSISIGLRVAANTWNIEFLWGTIFTILMGGIIFFSVGLPTIKRSWLFGSLFALLVLDLGTINYMGIQFRDPDKVYYEQADVAEWLKQQQGLFRVYSPSYSIPQLAGVIDQLELADGIDPLKLARYDQFMSIASGVPGKEYSVTVPRFSTGNPAVDNRAFRPEANPLGLLNVRYVVSAYPIKAENLELAAVIQDTYIYENLAVRPRVWLQNSNELSVGNTTYDTSSVTIAKYEPNRLVLNAMGEGIVVLSEIDYPGWEVFVDGRSATMLQINGLLRGVSISEGNHVVEFVFTPQAVFVGLAIALFSWAMILWVAGKLILKTRHAHV